jgi:biopolymer transport protein ExbD
MADVAFLLLVFFLVVSSLRADVGIPAVLPSARAAAARPAAARLSVAVDARGRVALDGEPLPADALRPRVAAWAHAGGVVVLRAAREAPYSAYIATLDAVLLGHQDARVAPRLALPQPTSRLK